MAVKLFQQLRLVAALIILVTTASVACQQSPATPFNRSKVALIIENRPNPILAPLILHFMSVVPSDWRFHFMGSPESIAMVNGSAAIDRQVKIGKLDVTLIPHSLTTSGLEEISVFMTNLWLYETAIQPAEWLLVFQTDSMLCANSRQSLDDWLDYDWVGAPWDLKGRLGGNGGLSLRRVSAIIDVLKKYRRLPNDNPEDVWLTDRLAMRPGAKLASGTISVKFSGETIPGRPVKPSSGRHSKASYDSPKLRNGKTAPDTAENWRIGHYEPMGYHTGGSGTKLWSPIWGTPKLREHIWNYCPEVKMTLDMDAAEYIPGVCHKRWARDLQFGDDIDNEALISGLIPW